jgi:mRNA interferase HigB
MRIITRRTLREFWERHPQAHEPLSAWHKNAKQAEWKNFAEVKADYNSVDCSGQLTIFDIGGNKYRLIVAIHYNTKMIFIRHVFTHAEYDRWNQTRSKRKKRG